MAYELHWVVGTAELPTEPGWIKEQEALVQAPLRPTGLFSAPADVRSVDDQLLLPAGSQLAKISGKYRGACSLHKSDRRDALASKKRICLIDTTADGAFDSWFAIWSGGSMWFVLEGKKYPEMGKLADIVLSEIDPAAFTGSPIFRLHYQRILDAGNALQKALDSRPFSSDREIGTRIRFHLEVGSEDFYLFGDLCDGKGLDDLCVYGDIPGEKRIFGLGLSILARNKEDLNIRVNSNFDPVEIGFTDDDEDNYPITGDYYVVAGSSH